MDGHAKDFPRKKIDNWGSLIQNLSGQGPGLGRLLDGKVTSSYQKFLTEEENAAILARARRQGRGPGPHRGGHQG